MAKQIWFIRHGQSVTNVGDTWTDHSSNPLTETGHEQAKQVSEALIEKPSLIVTSPYTRTKQTAHPTLEKWPEVLHEEWEVHEFATFCYKKHGLVSGSLWSEHAYDLFERNDPDYKDGDTAESFNELMGRVDRTIDKIHSMDKGKTAIFSHGFFLGILFIRLEMEKTKEVSMRDIFERRRSMHIPNTAISHFSFYDDGSTKMHSMSADHLSESERKLMGS